MERVSATMGSTARRVKRRSDHTVPTTAAVMANVSTTNALVIWVGPVIPVTQRFRVKMAVLVMAGAGMESATVTLDSRDKLAARNKNANKDVLMVFVRTAGVSALLDLLVITALCP